VRKIIQVTHELFLGGGVLNLGTISSGVVRHYTINICTIQYLIFSISHFEHAGEDKYLRTRQEEGT